MNTNQLYTVQQDGLSCKAVNPFYCERLSAYTCYELPEASICKGCRNHSDFEDANPILPLTTKQESGAEIEGELNWQYLNPAFGGCWVDIYFEPHDGILQRRQVVKPITPTNVSYQVDEGKETVEEAAIKYMNNWKIDMGGMYGYSKIHFIAGANWQKQQDAVKSEDGEK